MCCTLDKAPTMVTIIRLSVIVYRAPSRYSLMVAREEASVNRPVDNFVGEGLSPFFKNPAGC